MTNEKTELEKRIESGGQILLAEFSPPQGADPTPVRDAAKRYVGKVHALGVSDNRDRVCMSPLAAAIQVKAADIEPVLHVVTRDRNRIALVSDYLGAQALGVHNVLCTTGTHQILSRARAAKNVFDVDCIQLLQTYTGLASDARIVGEEGIDGCGPACLGGVASPFADPIELQMVRLAKKVAAGARFLITDPVFDVHRFNAWWEEVRGRGLHEKVAILAGVAPLLSAEGARARAAKRPDPVIPQAVIERIASAGDADAQRAAGIEIAVETVHQLSGISGLRGFQIGADGDHDAALEILEKSGLGIE